MKGLFATKSPSHKNPPKLITDTLTLVEFGVFVIWWHSYSLFFRRPYILKYYTYFILITYYFPRDISAFIYRIYHKFQYAAHTVVLFQLTFTDAPLSALHLLPRVASFLLTRGY